jgi:hypothetical protein
MSEVEIFRQSLEVSRVVMIITIIMTLISVTFSALTLAFQRSHDIKTVKPLCAVRVLRTGKLFQVLVKNAGLGPMIVTDVSIAEESSAVHDAGAECREKFKRMILSPNEERSVFETESPAFAVDPSRKITVEFRDIYDREYSLSEKLDIY